MGKREDDKAYANGVARVWQTSKSPRELMDITLAIASIGRLEDEIEALAQPQRDVNAPNVVIEPIVNTGRVAALKVVLDSKWKRVAKALPDLKAVEHSGNVDSTLTSRTMNDLELLHHWQNVRRRALQQAAQEALSEGSSAELIVDNTETPPEGIVAPESFLS